jgi:methionyl-tRNA synthetase
MTRRYITVAIPYVNARPHVGYALELVQADVLARHHRGRGDDVRFLGGTDDHALKNVLGAEASGLGTQAFVDRNAAAFESLRVPLRISFDDFIRTSRDPRHAPGVERLWRACAANGDFYQRWYEGEYCLGCEQFYAADDLVDGRCPEHGTPTEVVAEENWFFRLSRYRDRITAAIETGELAVVPEVFRNEVLGFLAHGLDDISVSRSRERARGWGLTVPDDPSQVIYVWWDALGNYITALDYGNGGELYEQWWRGADERVHVVGKGIVRFHAVYWPAILLSAGEPLPTTLYVHPYVTADGEKLSKSSGNAVDPVAVVEGVGTDALRWWFLRDVPRTADADFSIGRVVERSDEDLAHGVGNLVHRVVSMVHRLSDGRVCERTSGDDPAANAQIDTALRAYDFRAAVAVVRAAIDDANRRVDETRPWALPAGSQELADALGDLVARVRRLARLLVPFVPETAHRVSLALTVGPDGRLPPARPLVPRLDAATTSAPGGEVTPRAEVRSG